MIKAFVYRLYPTKTQRRHLERTLETCRRWYNACLAERKTVYAERGESVNKYDQILRAGQVRWARSSPLGGFAQEAPPL